LARQKRTWCTKFKIFKVRRIYRYFFSSTDPLSSDGRAKFDKLTRSYIECLSIVLIYRAFQNEASKGFTDRLSKVVDGQDHPDAGAAGASRDFLFELSIAARMTLSGYKVDFNKITDVVAENNEFLIHAECKRLSSGKKFEKNFKKAGEQIATQVKATNKNTYGLIFLDISSCLDSLPKREVSNDEEARRTIHKNIERFVEINSSKINHLTERFSGVSLGVCLIGQAPIWIRNHTLYMVTDTQVIAPQSLNDEDFGNLKKILDSFHNSTHSLV